MKKEPSVFALIYRIIVIALGLYLCLGWLIETSEGNTKPLVHLLIFWVGAWFWESVMYVWNKWIKNG